ncbi:MAG: hypothetical protein II333_09745 [Clostridia bacterium]|nr:hypothetical protein [Clostridia bacterium]
MPNTILTPDIIAREALMVLRNNAVMPKLVHRDYSSEFVAGVGNTITIRKPATFTANEFGEEIQIQDATESGVSVKMDKHLDVSFSVTSEQMALDIADFSEQLLVPAMQAFADKVDTYLLGLSSGITNVIDHASGAITPEDLVDARAMINKAPLANRYAVVSTTAEADLLKTELFVSAEKVGDNGTALREASLGRKFGMDIYSDQNIVKGSSYAPNMIFHKNAFALVTRPLAIPNGAGKAAIVNYDGFGLRVVYGYDIKTKLDVVSIDMLCGVAVLDKRLAAVIKDAR